MLVRVLGVAVVAGAVTGARLTQETLAAGPDPTNWNVDVASDHAAANAKRGHRSSHGSAALLMPSDTATKTCTDAALEIDSDSADSSLWPEPAISQVAAPSRLVQKRLQKSYRTRRHLCSPASKVATGSDDGSTCSHRQRPA